MSSPQITDHFKVLKATKDSDSQKKKSSPVFQRKTQDAAPSTSGAAPAPASEDDLALLKEFDLNWEFGPCMGITRLERWDRAEKHGMKPAPAVRDLIVQHSEDKRYTGSLWNDYPILN